MSSVEVRQIGHVAVAPVVQTLSAKGRSQTKAVLIVISNNRWLDDQGRPQERATSISWVVWGEAAVNAGSQLRVGSKVAISGALESRRYRNKEGKEVYTFDFTALSINYLESRADAEARRDPPAAAPVRQPARAPGNAGTKTSSSSASAPEA